MKTGDKIEFTPEQRESILPLYGSMLLTQYSAEAAEDRAAIAHSLMWRAIMKTLDLDTDFIYRILPGLRGVIAHESDHIHRIDLEALEVLNEYANLRDKIRDKMMKKFATPSETTESDTSSESVM